MLMLLNFLGCDHHCLHEPSSSQQLSSSWWMALLSIHHLFVQGCSSVCLCSYRMHHHNQHDIIAKWSFSHLLWYFLLLLELLVRYLDCFFECSLSGVLIQGFLPGGISFSSSLLLSLLLGATDVDGVLGLEKYDLISILKPGKSWLNLTSRFYYNETI